MTTAEISAETSQGAFRALADPSRRAILTLLSDHEMTIGEVAGHFDVTRAAVKKHLIILEEGGLISVQRHGRRAINRLQPEGLKPVAAWVNEFSKFWDDRLADLKMAVENTQGKDNG